MRHFLKYTALLMLAFITIATLISIGSFYVLKKSSFYKPSFLINDIQQNKFDYIVLGSSVGLTTLNTKLIDSLSNSSGINLSMDDTGLSSQYLMLEHFLAEGKKTDYCILAPGVAALDNKTADFGDNDYRFLMYVNRDYVQNYYKNASSTSYAARVSYLTKWLPFVGLSYFNTELFFPSLNALIVPSKRNRFDERGNYSYPKPNKKFKNKSLRTEKINFNHPYLKQIEALCKENDIQLIYYFAPMRSTDIAFNSPMFLVINDSRTVEDDTYFYDDIHLNYMGREKVSTKFAQSFKNILEESRGKVREIE